MNCCSDAKRMRTIGAFADHMCSSHFWKESMVFDSVIAHLYSWIHDESLLGIGGRVVRCSFGALVGSPGEGAYPSL